MQTQLTNTAYYTRLVIKFGSITIITLILMRIIWVVGTNVYLSLFPPPPPPPTVAFGKLPNLPFPEQKVPALTLSLQTPTGETPVLPKQTLVYFMPQATSSLLALDEATTIANSLDFNQNRSATSEVIYRFEKEDTPATLDINIVNKTFSLNYDLTQTPDLLNTRPRSTVEAEQAVKNLLSSGGILTTDLEEGRTSFEFLKVQDEKLVGAQSLSESQFVKVNLFRKPYNELPVLTLSKKNGNVWFIVTGSTSSDTNIIAGEYHYFPVDEKSSSTYPIKTAQQAWDELVSGKGFISQLPQETNIAVRRVYLAYYDSGKPQEFLQPIIVFEGDGGFLAFVPAVSREYYSQETTPAATVPQL